MTAYSIWSQGAVSGSVYSGAYTLGTTFELSGSCPLTGIWFYSHPSGALALPTSCAIFDVASQTVVSGTLNSSPSWSGAAGSGWVKCAYDGSVTLAASTWYVVVVFYGGASIWFTGTAGEFGGDITNGPVTAPDNADSPAAAPQAPYVSGASMAFPSTANSDWSFWVDVEVTPGGVAHTATAALTVTPSFSVARARGTYRTAALTVTPSFSAARARGHYRTGALEVIPVFAAVRIRGHYRSAALTVTPSFSAIPSGGAFAPPVFIYPAYWTAAWAQADTRVTVSPAGAQTATVTSAVLGESAATLYPPGPAVIYPSP